MGDEVRDEHLVQYLVVDGRIFDRDHIFDAPVEVARHPVGARDIEFRALVRQRRAAREGPDAAMLEEAADDRLDADRLRQTRHAGTQAAEDRKSTSLNSSHYCASR